jgi:hypothetical protein
MHFDEYGIYFVSETGFLIFSWVRRVKILKKSCVTSEKNSIFINKALKHFLCFWNMFVSNLKSFRAFTCRIMSWSKICRHNQFGYFLCENNTFVNIFTVKITVWRYQFYSKDKLQYFTVENVIKTIWQKNLYDFNSHNKEKIFCRFHCNRTTPKYVINLIDMMHILL